MPCAPFKHDHLIDAADRLRTRLDDLGPPFGQLLSDDGFLILRERRRSSRNRVRLGQTPRFRRLAFGDTLGLRCGGFGFADRAQRFGLRGGGETHALGIGFCAEFDLPRFRFSGLMSASRCALRSSSSHTRRHRPAGAR